MKAVITKIEHKDSKFGGIFFYMFLKGEDGKSYRTCIYPNCRNFSRWKSIIEEYHRTESLIVLKNLVIKKGTLIDADSLVEIDKRLEVETFISSNV